MKYAKKINKFRPFQQFFFQAIPFLVIQAFPKIPHLSASYSIHLDLVDISEFIKEQFSIHYLNPNKDANHKNIINKYKNSSVNCPKTFFLAPGL